MEKMQFLEEQSRKIVQMYRNGYSAKEIGDHIGASVNPVLRKLREEGVEIRPPAHLRDEFHFKRGDKPPQYVRRDIPEPWADNDAAYVFGVLIGDASIQYEYDEGKRTTPTAFTVTTPDKEFLNTLSKAFRSAFDIQVKDHTDNENPYVKANSVDFGRSYGRFRWRKEFWRVPEQFFDAPEEIKTALCQGKFDSDGGSQDGAIRVSSINKPGLEDIAKIAESLSFETSITGPYPPKHYELRIPKASSELFRLPRKKRKLQERR